MATTKKTMGQALDEAISRHNTEKPGAEAYAASICESREKEGHYWVELDVEHYSLPLVYYIPY